MHPILIRITDDFFIGTYGLMIAIGLLVASSMAAWRAKRRGLPPEAFYDLTFIAVVAGFVGARVLYIVTEFPQFLQSPAEYLFSRTGFVFLGGLVAAAGACIWYVRKKKLDTWLMADVIAPSIAIGHAFGRIGCHLAGCCFGGVSSIPGVGIEVPRVELPGGTVWANAYEAQLNDGLVGAHDLHSVAVWPTQLMESFSLFALCGVLLFFASRPHHRSVIFGVYLTAYSVIRFILEFFRGDEARGVYLDGMISTSQILSILLLSVGLWILWTAKNRPVFDPSNPPEPAADDSGKTTRRSRRKRTNRGEPAKG